ncbi:MAG: hypothetical protein IKL90_04245 [Alphaproteobacteria bacterium]|nr:hypothetical protein [Alphaproteobacteria bacterium]
MKKLVFIFLLVFFSFAVQNALAIPISDSGGYKSGQNAQKDADKDAEDEKHNSQLETSSKNRELGNNFSNDSLEFIANNKPSEGVNASLSSEDAKSTESIPEGINGSEFFKNTLLPAQTEDGKSRAEEAGIINSAETQNKRERALVEVATFGYALAAIHKNAASRNLSGKKNIDNQVSDTTNKTTNYSSTVSNNTSVKMSTAQIYNAIVLTAATNNMLTAISSADYVTDTNNSFKDVVGGMAIQAVGGIVGSFFD